MVGRVWPRHGHRGRPLNSVVRHQAVQMEAPVKSEIASNPLLGRLLITLSIVCVIAGVVTFDTGLCHRALLVKLFSASIPVLGAAAGLGSLVFPPTKGWGAGGKAVATFLNLGNLVSVIMALITVGPYCGFPDA